MNLDILKNDLLNRFASHTFTETANSPSTGRTKIEFKNGASAVIAEQNYLTADTFKKSVMYSRIREELVGGFEILPLLTESERDALSGEIEGENILNDDTANIERFHSSSWVPTNQILNGDYTFQGSTKFGGSESTAPNGAIDIVGVDAATARIRAVRFQNSANGAAALQLGHSRGSEGSPSALSSGDRLGQFIYVGDDGVTTNSAGPVMRGFTTEAWTGSAKGSNITFETIKNGATAETLALTLSEHGYPQTTSYTVATLPNVGGGGGIIFVSDETGGATLAFSDGTNWRRATDLTIVA